MVETAMFNVQRAITLKVGKPELQFMCFACRPIALHNCEVSWKYFRRYQGYGANTNDGSTDDGQTEGRSKFQRV